MEAYARYGRALMRKAERMLGSSSDAQDIVHALFADLLAKEGTDVSLPYLYRAVTNRCLATLRDESNRRRLLANVHKANAALVRPRGSDIVISLDLLAKLQDALDEQSCAIVVHHYLDEMTQEEVAELLSVSRKTVVRKLSAARKVLESLSSAPESRP